jgi:ADP-ribose pyrophosphatase
LTLLSSKRIHAGRVVSLDVDTVQFPNGEVGELEMMRHSGASAVVPFLDDPGEVDPRILLIRQFRHATEGWLWEIPAGRREGDEAPEATAHRELAEETGYTAGRLEQLTTIWTTPGFTDERIHIFRAWQLTPGATAHERDEVMELHEVPWSRAMAMVIDRTITDTKTLVGLLWLAAVRAG